MLEEKLIDKDGVIPLYHQLKTLLKGQIEEEVWKVDEMIPSERELSEQFEISRMTVRHAINDLVNEGILYRKRGMGTFVAKPKINQGLTKLSNFTSDMEQRGLKPGAKVLHVKVIPATKKIAELLQIKENDNVVELFRLRLANDEPMALERSFLPLEKVAPILTGSLENKSLYKELREKCNLNLALAKQSIEISYATQAEDAKLLDIEINTPVLLIERRTFTDTDMPVEYVQSLYRADRYKFSIEMKV
ncbi:GntR family transcriptional regulator [Halalkalibacter krulwichiae]|uniref:HTH-type transcriptional repressor YvoA n=1 Tax=Halalkalibacter krulwichiae TaxID=199441 RepID=A0A1X9MG27_9BACI|nr:GntR family transcriptional regulator [Halalkalibacter krulwichiae]ARK32415.1 HTH-type transcriptional repressor YvoA [Halalkalibacter krulwichiae]